MCRGVSGFSKNDVNSCFMKTIVSHKSHRDQFDTRYIVHIFEMFIKR
jgi:hypothetical protein